LPDFFIREKREAFFVRLTEEQIMAELATVPSWTRLDEKWIQRKYKFSTFPDAIAYVNKVADIAEEVQHHPFISIDYKLVTLKMSSWQAGGLTQLDFDLAKRFDDVFAGFAKGE
jgi:4a-hydroxytetrahydrobiopterin dehydratase